MKIEIKDYGDIIDITPAINRGFYKIMFAFVNGDIMVYSIKDKELFLDTYKECRYKWYSAM